jgi:16S rRNA (cytosine967-C5)-methyltransferase
VLVDAPCSGVGTWQRNPQAKWTSSSKDLDELAVTQLNLLHHVADGVKPGGKLIYSVCTLTRRETNEVLRAFEKRAPDFRPLSVKNPFELDATETPYQWWWPQQSRGNGMFIAVWQRMQVRN